MKGSAVGSFSVEIERSVGRQARSRDRFTVGRPTKERSKICWKARDYIRANPHPQDKVFKCPPHAEAAPKVVLDTNVVLDWLVFRNPQCAAAGSALSKVGTDALDRDRATMRDELAHVLRSRRGRRLRRQSRTAPLGEYAFGADFQRLCLATRAWEKRLPSALLCTDPDDQKFIDLAVSERAAWLDQQLDRAVLALQLARRAHIRFFGS